jgi:hypothetical protein
LLLYLIKTGGRNENEVEKACMVDDISLFIDLIHVAKQWLRKQEAEYQH